MGYIYVAGEKRQVPAIKMAYIWISIKLIFM